jgi:hypothetical protein
MSAYDPKRTSHTEASCQKKTKNRCSDANMPQHESKVDEVGISMGEHKGIRAVVNWGFAQKSAQGIS